MKKNVGSIKWPADHVERRSVESLIPYARNARTHSEEQVAQIAASIKEWGWTTPVLIDEDGGIIAGHGRVMAARKLGIEDVPVMIARGWTEAQRRAYVLADNQLAANAGWDMDLLKVEIGDLSVDGFDLDLIGFDDKMLTGLMAEETEGLTDADAVPEAPEEPVTVLGDVWVLGRHRIVCGDATNIDDWKKLDVGSNFILFTSPPYNTSGSSKLSGNKSSSKRGKFYDNYSDDLSIEDYAELLQQTFHASISYVEAMVFNVQPLAGAKRSLMSWMSALCSHLVDIITWDKGTAAPHIQPGIMTSRYEWLVIFSKDQNASRVVPLSSWQGKFSNVYQAPPQKENKYASMHGATFPSHLPEFIVGDLMNRCRGVVDCFLGTGTTIIAAERLGRDGRGIELSPAYVDIAVKRWQDFTGQEAIHAETGKTFNEMSHARHNAQT